ncbi:MAG: M28 family peptidase [Acidobacteria bacterium]|nr:M28 family peptidase [Acidobacteriota bacterium]
MKKLFGLVLLAGGLVAASSVAPVAQEREDRTLLSHEQMTAIINEVSGERAMHTLLELVPYQRVRNPAEYDGPFQESTVMANLAKEYGFDNVTIESFSAGQAWQPTQGELWMTAPKSVKIYDVHDVALSLATLNASGDFSGELVDIGAARPEDFDAQDLTGKFVLSAESVSGLSQVYSQAIQRGAVGVIGVNAIGAQRALDFPDQIVSTGVNAQDGKPAWNAAPRVARELKALLARGDEITIRSINQTVQVPTRSEVVHAEILGDGSTTQEVAIGGHLYEGVIKQGANDDNSGCALTLEIGRAYIKLIKEGKLPRPKRTINFQWLAEISGTNYWLNAHPEKASRIIGDLNFDMEGIRVSQSRSYWILQRTPDTFPSYINDIAQSNMEYIADISRERVRFRGNGYLPSQLVESARGSKDAFYIKIDKHYGSSDHVTYMQHGIPAVMFITWPDMWYHSSEDTPDKQDTTQYKRAAAVGLGSLAALSEGTDTMAARIVNENLGRGLARMGESHTKGLGYLADATDAASLAAAYRDARVSITHQAQIEKAVVDSASILYTDVNAGKAKTAVFSPLIDRRSVSLLDEVAAAYQLQASQRGMTLPANMGEPVLSVAEQEAANLVVEQVPAPAGGRGGGRGRGAAGPSLPTEFNAEFRGLLSRNMTVLEIRDFLSGEFTPLPIETVMAVLRATEASGSIKLVPRK